MPSAFDGQLPNGWDECWGCKQNKRMFMAELCEPCWREKDAADEAGDIEGTGGKSYYRPAPHRS